MRSETDGRSGGRLTFGTLLKVIDLILDNRGRRRDDSELRDAPCLP